MFGTLEAKSDALASAQALERPKWMEVTPPEQWYVRRVYHNRCGIGAGWADIS